MSEQIGVTGLATMGASLARNFARHGHQVVLHNRTQARTDALLAAHGGEGDFARIVPGNTCHGIAGFGNVDELGQRIGALMIGLQRGREIGRPGICRQDIGRLAAGLRSRKYRKDPR